MRGDYCLTLSIILNITNIQYHVIVLLKYANVMKRIVNVLNLAMHIQVIGHSHYLDYQKFSKIIININ